MLQRGACNNHPRSAKTIATRTQNQDLQNRCANYTGALGLPRSSQGRNAPEQTKSIRERESRIYPREESPREQQTFSDTWRATITREARIQLQLAREIKICKPLCKLQRRSYFPDLFKGGASQSKQNTNANELDIDFEDMQNRCANAASQALL